MSELSELRKLRGHWKTIRTQSSGGRNPALHKKAVRQIRKYKKAILVYGNKLKTDKQLKEGY